MYAEYFRNMILRRRISVEGKAHAGAVALIALLTVLPLAAQNKPRHAAKSAAEQDPMAAETAQRGRKDFLQYCSFCHGTDANGGAEGPNLVRSGIVRHDKNGDLIGQVIRDGRPDKGMPALPLTTSQIADVVAFLHARLAESDRTSPRGPSSDYALKLLLTGNAEAGKAYFNGAGGCSGCHSPTGDLAGIARKYAPADLQTRFLYPKGPHRTAMVTLRSGARVKGELLDKDAFNVSIRDENGWYRSWPLRDVQVEIHDPLAAHRELVRKYTDADVHDLFAYLETLK
jgi:cytochrome c oxidase cbb3-type subunit 3